MLAKDEVATRVSIFHLLDRIDQVGLYYPTKVIINVIWSGITYSCA